MAAQSSFECDVFFNITEGGLELIFFCFGGGVLSKFLLDNSSFSAPLLIIIAQSLMGSLSLYVQSLQPWSCKIVLTDADEHVHSKLYSTEREM